MNTAAITRLTLTTDNLHLALDKSVAVEGKHLGKGLDKVPLSQLIDPDKTGAETFTEVYFTTTSESFYRICRRPIIRGNWVLQGKRQGATLPDYPLSPGEMQNSSLNIGVPFPFGARLTGNVVAILAVDTDHAFTIEHILRHTDMGSDIRQEFKNFQ